MDFAEKVHKEDCNRETRCDSNKESGGVCKPHPFKDVNDLIWPQASIMLSEAIMVAHAHKTLRDNIKYLDTLSISTVGIGRK